MSDTLVLVILIVLLVLALGFLLMKKVKKSKGGYNHIIELDNESLRCLNKFLNELNRVYPLQLEKAFPDETELQNRYETAIINEEIYLDQYRFTQRHRVIDNRNYDFQILKKDPDFREKITQIAKEYLASGQSLESWNDAQEKAFEVNHEFGVDVLYTLLSFPYSESVRKHNGYYYMPYVRNLTQNKIDFSQLDRPRESSQALDQNNDLRNNSVFQSFRNNFIRGFPIFDKELNKITVREFSPEELEARQRIVEGTLKILVALKITYNEARVPDFITVSFTKHVVELYRGAKRTDIDGKIYWDKNQTHMIYAPFKALMVGYEISGYDTNGQSSGYGMYTTSDFAIAAQYADPILYIYQKGYNRYFYRHIPLFIPEKWLAKLTDNFSPERLNHMRVETMDIWCLRGFDREQMEARDGGKRETVFKRLIFERNDLEPKRPHEDMKGFDSLEEINDFLELRLKFMKKRIKKFDEDLYYDIISWEWRPVEDERDYRDYDIAVAWSHGSRQDLYDFDTKTTVAEAWNAGFGSYELVVKNSDYLILRDMMLITK